MDTTPPRWLRRTASMPAPGLAFGADYNPEQWPRATWDEDVAAMRAAGVTIVSVGIFAWARLQPTADTWAFEWLDDVMDLLPANGVAVDLDTATASPPPWLTAVHVPRRDRVAGRPPSGPSGTATGPRSCRPGWPRPTPTGRSN